MLNPDLLTVALHRLRYSPNIDLFASRINHQTDTYVSFKPDPGAYATDAFSLNWAEHKFLAFPPFALVSRVLQKINEDQATGILVAPCWPNQGFYPVLMQMLVEVPILFSPRTNLLQLPSQPLKKHRLHKSLKLLICLVSGCNAKIKAFHKKLQTSSLLLGDQTLGRCMLYTSTNGSSMQLGKISIPTIRL